MVKYIWVVLQLLIPGIIYCQSSTFNLPKLLPYPETEFNHMILCGDTIVIYGVGFNNNVEWKQGVAVATLDTFGHVIAHNFIMDEEGDLLATDKAWGNIVQTSDGGFAAIAATVGRKSAFLIKMTNDLQVEFIKEYADTVNLSNYFYKLLETPEGYLLYGNIQRPDYYTDGFIRYVDKQGETIWFKNIEFSAFSTTTVNIQNRTNTTYIASFVSSTNIQENTGFSSFTVFDLNGNESGFWQFPLESEVGLNRKIIVTNEGRVITFGLFLFDIIGTTPIYQPTLIGFDDQFMPIRVRHFGRTGSLNTSVMLWDFAPTIDGHYIGAGETLVKDGSDPTRRVGWLYKFSTDGDSIWERKINAPFLPLYYTNSGFFAGVGVLASGSIIAGGSTNEGNNQYCWLVKVTNDGCLDTLYCQPVSSVSQPDSQPLQIDIYPIPASTYFNIQSPVAIKQITVFDVPGRRVLVRQNTGRSVRIDLPADLPVGLYFVEIQTETGQIIWKQVYIG